MDYIIVIGLIATIMFLIKNNTNQSGQKSKKYSKDGSDPWTSNVDKSNDLEDLLPKGFLEQSGDKILDFTKPREKENISDYSDIYVLEESILTPAELKYMKSLQKVVEDKYYILSKVRVADVFRVKRKRFGEAEYKWFNKIKSKHFDYVLCCPETFKPLIIIELDDKSHNKIEVIKRDRFINKICNDGGVRIIRWPVRFSYDHDEMKKRILNDQ